VVLKFTYTHIESNVCIRWSPLGSKG